jgi:phosphatidate phosphatase APP1
MRKSTTLISCILLLLLSSVAAFGQAVYGNIAGTVTDPQGAAVANATVTITDTARQASVTTATNTDGNFTQRGLIAGEYQIRIEATGFKAAVQNVTVSVDQETRAELKMEIGDVSEVVEITSGAPIL